MPVRKKINDETELNCNIKCVWMDCSYGVMVYWAISNTCEWIDGMVYR
jgi:hypothetical protein